jgi:coenzyme F420-reducing hydrogenase delta subunit
MERTVETEAIKFNKEHCGECTLCNIMCPFEAINLDKDTGEIRIDIEKCQICGICTSGCPVSAIELPYYDDDALADYVKRRMETLETKTLVVMCRGSSPPSCELLDVLKERKVKKFIPLRVPCVGRLTIEFYLRVISIDINQIIVVQCEENSCRFERGSTVSTKKILLLSNLLKNLGYDSDVLTIINTSLKVVYDTDRCVGCDKCEYVCPDRVIASQHLSTPQIDIETCKGCGVCAVICPQLAIQLKGFEYEPSSQAIRKYKTKADLNVKDSPVVLVFCCQWAEFSALDSEADAFVKENAIVVEIPCYNALDPLHVLDAFHIGFDGVLVLACSEDDCKLKERRSQGKRNFSALGKALKKLELSERFEINAISPRYINDFNSKLESFIKKISSLQKTENGGEQ